jgi:hypothetical protein
MSLHWPSAKDIVLGGTVPLPFADFFNHLLPFQCRLTEREQAYHAAIFGASGSGKSKLLQSVFLQHLAKGNGVGLIDPHADLALDILKSLVASGYFRKAEAFDQLIFLLSSRSLSPNKMICKSFSVLVSKFNSWRRSSSEGGRRVCASSMTRIGVLPFLCCSIRNSSK